MVVNFSKCRDSLILDKELAISNMELNPAHAVEKASLAATPVSLEDACATPSVDIFTEMPSTQSKKFDNSKGKSVVSSTLKLKRTYKVNEAEGPRKKSS